MKYYRSEKYVFLLSIQLSNYGTQVILQIKSMWQVTNVTHDNNSLHFAANIVDCCDGTDEYDSSTNCANTCK